MNDVLSARNVNRHPTLQPADLTRVQAMFIIAHLIRSYAVQPELIQSFLLLSILQNQYAATSSQNYPLNLFYAPFTENPNGDVASKREQIAARVRRASSGVWSNFQTPRSSAFHGAEPKPSTGRSDQAPPRTDSSSRSYGSQERRSTGATDTSADEAAPPPRQNATPADYALLGLKPDAQKDEITKAYRAKARTAHSDKGGNDADMALVNAAYDRIRDAHGFR